VLTIIFYFFFLSLTAIIAFEDFKSREISLWAIILYFIILIGNFLREKNWQILIQNIGFTLVYFGFCFLVLYLYFFIKEKKLTSIIDTKLGLADIFIFLAIGFTLDIVSLILFFTVSFSISALIGLIILGKQKTVPLAGILVILYLFFYIFISPIQVL